MMTKVINFIEAAHKHQLSRSFKKKYSFEQIGDENCVVIFPGVRKDTCYENDKPNVVDKLSVQPNSKHLSSKDEITSG